MSSDPNVLSTYGTHGIQLWTKEGYKGISVTKAPVRNRITKKHPVCNPRASGIFRVAKGAVRVSRPNRVITAKQPAIAPVRILTSIHHLSVILCIVSLSRVSTLPGWLLTGLRSFLPRKIFSSLRPVASLDHRSSSRLPSRTIWSILDPSLVLRPLTHPRDLL